MRLIERQMGYNSINNMQQVVSRAHGRSLARRNGDRKCSAPLADGLRHSIAEVHFPLKEKPPPWRRGWLARDQACAVVAPAQHAPEPLPQRAVCARSPGTARATAVREVHRLIDQSVRNDVIQLKSLRSGPKICVAQLKSLIWVPEFVWYLSLN